MQISSSSLPPPVFLNCSQRFVLAGLATAAFHPCKPVPYLLLLVVAALGEKIGRGSCAKCHLTKLTDRFGGHCPPSTPPECGGTYSASPIQDAAHGGGTRTAAQPGTSLRTPAEAPHDAAAGTEAIGRHGEVAELTA